MAKTPPEQVFPAHAGMNRIRRAAYRAALGVPRPRGDEPVLRLPSQRSDWLVFPAHAGMNRLGNAVRDRALSVPRPRGDEPGDASLAMVHAVCSPPTRG